MPIEAYDKLTTPQGSGYGITDADQVEGAYLRVATLDARDALESKIRLADRTTCYVAETDRVYVWSGSDWVRAEEDGKARVAIETAAREAATRNVSTREDFEEAFVFGARDPGGILRAPVKLFLDGSASLSKVRFPLGILRTFSSRTEEFLVEADGDGKIIRAVYPNKPRSQQVDVSSLDVRGNPYNGAVPMVDADRKIVGFIPKTIPMQGRDFKSRVSYGGLPVVDSDNKVIITLATVGDEEASSTYAEDDIRTFEPTIDLTGSTDESAKLKSAHDAAAAAGLRNLYIEGPVLAPSALFLGDVFFRTRTGKGRLIGTYKKRVIPDGSGCMEPLVDVVPETHLARWNAAVAAATPSSPAIMVIMGDSWGLPAQQVGELSQLEYLGAGQLRRAFRAQYGAKADDGSIVIVNRGIGAKTWVDGAGVTDSPYGWYTNPEEPWLSYVTSIDLSGIGLGTDLKPHLVMFYFGMNHGTLMNSTDWDAINHCLDTVQAIDPQPDVLMVAGTAPSAMSPTRGLKTSQEARRSMAGIARSVAAVRGLGLIDWGRYFDAAHWGIDPRLTYFREVDVPSIDLGAGYTWPEEVMDYSFEVTNDQGPTDDAFWATGDGMLHIPLSSIPGNELVIERDVGGTLAYTVYACSGSVEIARTVTTVTTTTSGGTLRFACQGPIIYCRWRTGVVVNTVVHRGGGQFTPTVGFGGVGSADVTANIVSVSDTPLVSPYLTDTECWGGPDTDVGGNDENHMAEPLKTEVFQKSLLATRFR